MARALVILLAIALVAAGCGVRNSKPFTAKGSVGCFKQHAFTNVTTDPAQLGFIAGFADNGGIKAASPTGNVLTIAFTADENSTGSTQQAFKLRAPKRLRPHMSDIMRTERNAVLVWTVSPTADEYDVARRCLKP